jgi:flagella basal body P-ring formation protein FlgA
MSAALLVLLTLPHAAADDGIALVGRAVQEHVAERLGMLAEDVEIVHLGVASLPSCAAQARAVVESPAAERFRGHADVTVTLYAEAEPCASLRLRPHLRTWAEVPVASETLEPGTEARWELARVTTERSAGRILEPAELAEARWLTRTTIAAGEPLTELSVRPRPDASSGEQVQVLAGQGPLLVKTPGRLMADAFVGDTVRVANMATRGVHDGTLFAPGCVAAGAVTPRMEEACPHVRNP